jgi:hypothetical protein
LFEKEFTLLEIRAMTKRLFEFCLPGEEKKADQSPPVVEACAAYQVAGVPPNLPTMGVAFGATDPQSDIATRYFTVSVDGKMLAREEIRGAGLEAQFSPAHFPEGDLTVTAFAVNGEGLEQSSTCRLVGWDTSLPAGLANGQFAFQSHSAAFRLQYSIEETTPLSSVTWAIGTAHGGEELRPYEALPTNTLTGKLNSQGHTLLHGQFYYLSVKVVNTLGYESLLRSEGVLVDLTPPRAPYHESIVSEQFEHVGCDLTLLKHSDDSVPMRDLYARCLSPDPSVLNHRLVIGNGSLYNGAVPGEMAHFQRAVSFLTANWCVASARKGQRRREAGATSACCTSTPGSNVCQGAARGLGNGHLRIHVELGQSRPVLP